MNSDVKTALINWLDAQEDKDQTMMASGGHSFTASELISEIELETNFGKKIELDIIKLTVDLLFRKIEKV